MRRFAHLLFWWRTWVTAACAVLIAVMLFTVIDSARGRAAAQHNAALAIQKSLDTASRASRRIDLLSAQIADLQAQLTAAQASRSAENAAAVQQIAALSEQLRQLGVRPVVTSTLGERSPPSTAIVQAPQMTSSTTTIPVRRSETTTLLAPRTTTSLDPDPVHRTTTTQGVKP